MRARAGIIGLVLMSIVLALGFASPAWADEAPQVPWLTYTLAVHSVEVGPERLEGKPEGERFVVITFKAIGAKVANFDIMDNVPLFSIEDAGGEYYEGAAFIPHSMMFLPGPGAFGTCPEQAAFDIVFVLPESIPLDEMTLYVAEFLDAAATAVPLAEITQVGEGGA